MTGQTQLMLLAPPYYEGDVDSCVVGRLVLLRGPFQIERKKTAGGRGRGKGAQCTAILKTEAHFLGGPTVSELLYVEAWGEAATDFAKAVRIGGGYCISGGDVVSAAPQYSTSRLHYYMKVKAPLGIATRVTETSDKPWTDLPATHPFHKRGESRPHNDCSMVAARFHLRQLTCGCPCQPARASDGDHRIVCS